MLRETVRRWHAKAASAVVLDPRTGDVLAMAAAPNFDANRFSQTRPDYLRNRTVTDTYEPGSTFKLIPVAGALSEGLVTPQCAFTLAPSIRVADRVIHEHDPRPTVRMTVADIVADSSNVGAITLAEKLGSERLANWIDRFGFGRRTGIDFPGETPGIVLPLEHWSGSTIGNLPIGHGIAVTPVQMAAAYAAVANGGVWVQPHLVEHVVGHGRPTEKRRRILSPRVASQLATMLTGVVSEHGTGARGGDPRLPRRRQDGHRGQGPAGRRRLLDLQVRRVVRRLRSGDAPAARDPRHRRRAHDDLGRRRRGPGLPGARPLRPPVPRGAAGRAGERVGLNEPDKLVPPAQGGSLSPPALPAASVPPKV